MYLSDVLIGAADVSLITYGVIRAGSHIIVLKRRQWKGRRKTVGCIQYYQTQKPISNTFKACIIRKKNQKLKKTKEIHK